MTHLCSNCLHRTVYLQSEPCKSCVQNRTRTNWQPEKPVESQPMDFEAFLDQDTVPVSVVRELARQIERLEAENKELREQIDYQNKK